MYLMKRDGDNKCTFGGSGWGLFRRVRIIKEKGGKRNVLLFCKKCCVVL